MAPVTKKVSRGPVSKSAPVTKRLPAKKAAGHARDAGTGRYVDLAEAKRRPKEVVIEKKKR